MAKHTQTIRRQIADELFECGHFVNLALKGLTRNISIRKSNKNAETKHYIGGKHKFYSK